MEIKKSLWWIVLISFTLLASPLAAQLSSITLSAGTLTPGFNAGMTSYAASVANSVSRITGTGRAAAGVTVRVYNAWQGALKTHIHLALRLGKIAS